MLVILSPHEVNHFLPDIRKSEAVHLHQYSPRVTHAAGSFEDLNFHCIPPLDSKWLAPATEQIFQLNLWAGQLYLPDYGTYSLLCEFLGILTKELAIEPESVQSVGLTKPAHCCPFTLPWLNEHIGRQQKGMDFSTSHLGQILSGKELTREEFQPTPRARRTSISVVF